MSDATHSEPFRAERYSAAAYDEPEDIAVDEHLPSWTDDSPENLLKFLFASPRPCAALDRLLAN